MVTGELTISATRNTSPSGSSSAKTAIPRSTGTSTSETTESKNGNGVEIREKELPDRATTNGGLKTIQKVKERSRSFDATKEDSAPEGNCNTKDKSKIGRSWSMLELYEMQIIHHLQDDMVEMLALDDENDQGLRVSPQRSETTKGYQDMINPIGNAAGANINEEIDDDDDGFFFFDEDEDKDDDQCNNSTNNLTEERNDDTHKTSFLQTMEGSPKKYSDSEVQLEVCSPSPKAGTLPTIGEENSNKKKKIKRGILGKILMKRSVSLGIFSKGASSSDLNGMDQSSHHRMDQSFNYRMDQSSNYSIDHTQHTSLDQSINNDAVVGHHSSADLQSLSHEDLSMDTSRHTDGIGSLLDNPHLISDKYTRTKSEYQPRASPKSFRSFADQELITKPAPPRVGISSNEYSQKSAVDVYRHDRNKKPAQSILKKATSMLDLSGQNHPQSRGSQVDKTAKSMKRVTSFSTLEIREYKVIIGDNPGGKRGPPVSLDWNYCPDSTVKMCIEKYESTRPKRRQKHEMYMSGSIRMWNLMKGFGYTMGEIKEASKAADLVRKHRVNSIKYKKVHDLPYKFGKLLGLNRERLK
eukprot:scaffold3111_cov263-Chaetoceros_neogracile.AAC.9